MSEILITGGNGFVGEHLVAALQDRGDRVRVLALPSEDTCRLQQRGVQVHRGDVRHRDTLTEPMSGVDAVVHLAAMMDVWRPLPDYYAVNVIGTENVCTAALAAGVSRLVHMSSTSVYGVALGRPADEWFPLCPFPDPYPLTKAAADVGVQRMIARRDLPAVIIRPDQIFGPGDRLHFARIADQLRARKRIIVGSGDNVLPLVYIADAVQGLLLALDRADAVGQAYNISAELPLTQAQLLCAIADQIGAPPPRFHLPYRALYAAGYVAERLATLTRSARRPPITRLGVAFVGADNRYSIAKARRELGYSPRVSLEEGVRLTAAWYRQCAMQRPLPVPAAAEPVAEGIRS